MKAELITPCEAYLESYLQACIEYKENAVRTYSLHDPDAFDQWKEIIFQRFEKDRLGVDLREGHVPSTTLWLVEDGAYIGTGNIRHKLTDSLSRFGGHIGYAIRFGMWGKGYGTLQLKLLLVHAAELGIERALITCDETNVGSARVIEKCGGVYQDTIGNVVEGVHHDTKRYWIDTKHA